MISSAQLTSVQRLAPVLSNLHRLHFAASSNPFAAHCRATSKRQQLASGLRSTCSPALVRQQCRSAM